LTAESLINIDNRKCYWGKANVDYEKVFDHTNILINYYWEHYIQYNIINYK